VSRIVQLVEQFAFSGASFLLMWTIAHLIPVASFGQFSLLFTSFLLLIGIIGPFTTEKIGAYALSKGDDVKLAVLSQSVLTTTLFNIFTFPIIVALLIQTDLNQGSISAVNSLILCISYTVHLTLRKWDAYIGDGRTSIHSSTAIVSCHILLCLYYKPSTLNQAITCTSISYFVGVLFFIKYLRIIKLSKMIPEIGAMPFSAKILAASAFYHVGFTIPHYLFADVDLRQIALMRLAIMISTPVVLYATAKSIQETKGCPRRSRYAFFDGTALRLAIIAVILATLAPLFTPQNLSITPIEQVYTGAFIIAVALTTRISILMKSQEHAHRVIYLYAPGGIVTMIIMLGPVPHPPLLLWITIVATACALVGALSPPPSINKVVYE
jgi:hypothetical protein